MKCLTFIQKYTIFNKLSEADFNCSKDAIFLITNSKREDNEYFQIRIYILIFRVGLPHEDYRSGSLHDPCGLQLVS